MEVNKSLYHVYFTILCYFITLYIAYIYRTRPIDITVTQTQVNANSFDLPILGSKNTTKVLNQKFQQMKNDYEVKLLEKDWKILRSSQNISVELLETKGWPLYIKLIANFQNIQPKQLLEYFQLEKYEKTQKAIDPFFDKSSLLIDVNREFKVLHRVSTKFSFFEILVF